jgi:hypothetical protein
MSPEKQKLIELEKTGLYVFHGSGFLLEKLEPKQALNFVDGKDEKDGNPAVFTASYVEYAIFMAIVNSKNCPDHARSGVSVKTRSFSTSITYSATQSTLDQLSEKSVGWVYVFNKTDFERLDRGGVEYASYVPVVPIEKVCVSFSDLPEPIKIYEANH